MRKIIIDTNFLLVPGQFNVDIFSEFGRLFGENNESFIIDKTKKEMRDILEKGGRDRKAANVAFSLLDSKKIKELPSGEEYVDDAIVSICRKEGGYAVATNDSELKKRLRQIDVDVIELKQKKYLAIRK